MEPKGRISVKFLFDLCDCPVCVWGGGGAGRIKMCSVCARAQTRAGFQTSVCPNSVFVLHGVDAAFNLACQ